MFGTEVPPCPVPVPWYLVQVCYLGKRRLHFYCLYAWTQVLTCQDARMCSGRRVIPRCWHAAGAHVVFSNNSERVQWAVVTTGVQAQCQFLHALLAHTLVIDLMPCCRTCQPAMASNCLVMDAPGCPACISMSMPIGVYACMSMSMSACMSRHMLAWTGLDYEIGTVCMVWGPEQS